MWNRHPGLPVCWAAAWVKLLFPIIMMMMMKVAHEHVP
jgi:hypothetical protein